MLTLQCTQKLLKELKTDLSPVKDADPITLWHANLITLDRRKCVLFTNDKTRYTFLVPGLKKPDFQMMGEMFLDNLFRCMRNDGLEQEGVEKVLSACSNYCFTKTSSKSVLGTMNDIADIIKWTVYDNGGLANTDIYGMMNKLNRMPMKPLDYRFSVDAFRRMLSR
jgi:hypothetical protein